MDECHVSKSSPRSPFGPSHHETKREEGEWYKKKKKKKKNWNLEEDSGLEWIYELWVPCAIYPRERERERETQSQPEIGMKGYICMNM